MKTLIILLLMNSSVLDANSAIQKDSLFRRYINKVEMGFNLNYHQTIYKPKDPSKIDAQQEYNHMIELQNQSQGQISYAGYNHPNQLCFTYGGGKRVLSGLYFKSPIKIRNIILKLVYGLNFSYEESVLLSTKEKRMEIYTIHVNYLNSQGNLSHLEFYGMDTTTVRITDYEYGVNLPLAVNYPFSKKWSFEIGGFLLLKARVKVKYEDSDGNYKFNDGKIGTGLYFSEHIALNYQISKRLELQLGYQPKYMVFGAIRFKLIG